MNAKRTATASTHHVQFRCTPAEFDMWTRLASKRGKTLRDMIRDGLNQSIATICLCEPGKPACQMCSQPAPK
jgi:hypothetical protein